jgi:hypothetical protein
MRGKAGKDASARDAVFDSHQDVFHFPKTLVGLSGLKWSLALKGRVRRPKPVDRFLPFSRLAKTSPACTEIEINRAAGGISVTSELL